MEEENQVCKDCKKSLQDNDKQVICDGVVCGSCRENYISCADCESVVRTDDSFTIYRGSPVCEQCFNDNYSTCSDCERNILNDDARYCDACENNYCLSDWTGGHCRTHDHYVCGSCLENSDECNTENTISYRECNEASKVFQSQELGRIIKSPRLFGVEIESYYPNIEKVIEAIKEIPKEVGIATDGSLGSKGLEFQTPPASGDKGEKLIKEVCNTLNKYEFTVQRSCGLHIHLDGKGFIEGYAKIKHLWLFYLAFEDCILSFLPKSRRVNTFCIPFKRGYHYKEIAEIGSREKLERIWYRDEQEAIKKRKEGKYDGTRYNGFNFHSLFASGHLEIRYHSGTLQAEKILHWVNLHARILDKIASGEIEVNEMAQAMDMLTLSEKMDKMFELLELEKTALAYWKARAHKFNPTMAEENEMLVDTTEAVCAV